MINTLTPTFHTSSLHNMTLYMTLHNITYICHTKWYIYIFILGLFLTKHNKFVTLFKAFFLFKGSSGRTTPGLPGDKVFC